MKVPFHTQEEVREKLRELIDKKYKHQSKAAKAWNCSAPFVNAVLQSLRDPTPIILSELGLEKVKGYVWIDKKNLDANEQNSEADSQKTAAKNPKILWQAFSALEYQKATVDLRKKLHAHIENTYGSRKLAAEAWGCSVGLVSHVVSGNKQFSSAMLKDLGLERITGYRKASNANKEKQP